MTDAPADTLSAGFDGGALRLRIACACGRSVELPRRIAVARFGPAATLAQISAVARCSVCKRCPAEVALTYPDAPGCGPRPVLSHFGGEDGAPRPQPLAKRRRRAGRQSDQGWPD